MRVYSDVSLCSGRWRAAHVEKKNDKAAVKIWLQTVLLLDQLCNLEKQDKEMLEGSTPQEVFRPPMI